MNAVVNKLLLEGDIFILEIHLRHPGFAYRASGTFTKNKKGTKKIK